MTHLLNKTAKQLRAEYRQCFVRHQELAQSYAEGRADSTELKASADYLKQLRNAHTVVTEAA
jgi:hypothetical protein